MNKAGLVKGIESLSGLIFVGVLWKFGFNSEGFRLATISMMITLSLLVVVAKFLKVPLTPMQSSAWFLTMTLGTLSVVLKNPIYYKLKTTFLYLGVSSVFLGSHLIGDKTILERLFSQKIEAPRKLVRKISFWTIIYLTSAAFLNYYIATYYPTHVWSYFKYGILIGLNFVFIVCVVYSLRDYVKDFIQQQSK